MPKDISVSEGESSFEQLKQTTSHGAEYWSARDLQALLGYSQWRAFEAAINRAMESCRQSSNVCERHFVIAKKNTPVGKGATRDVPDFHLSRFACYLIAMNGDPRKPQIAYAQKYFAIQVRRQEISDVYVADLERLELREQVTLENKALNSVAQEAGVASSMFGVFHDAGYKTLYGGYGVQAIKKLKGIPEKDALLDRMETTELAANQFRITQTRDKMQKHRITGEQAAISIHANVGSEVREAIKRIGGTLPEQLAPGIHINEVKKRIKESTPKLELDERDAKGLIADES